MTNIKNQILSRVVSKTFLLQKQLVLLLNPFRIQDLRAVYFHRFHLWLFTFNHFVVVRLGNQFGNNSNLLEAILKGLNMNNPVRSAGYGK